MQQSNVWQSRVGEEVTLGHLQLNGYSLLQCCIYYSRTGGVIMFLKNHFKYTVYKIDTRGDYLWLFAANVLIASQLYLITINSLSSAKEGRLDAQFLRYFEAYLEGSVGF